MSDIAKMRDECERLMERGEYRRAAQQFLELCDGLVLREEWAEAVKAADAAAEAAHRVGLRIFLKRGEK
jgi:hypothetical protein